MRIIKEPDERRNEILDTAEELFMINGYDKTSVQGIIDKVGIAKGTFYYYFKSKEEVLDGMVERYNEKIYNKAVLIAGNKELSCEMRLLGVIQAMQISDEVNPVMMEQIHTPQNVLLHQKIAASILTVLVPVLTEIVKEGMEQEIFHTLYPKESIEMLLVYGVTMLDGNFIPLTEEEKYKKTNAMIAMGERLLGIKAGSFMKMMGDKE